MRKLITPATARAMAEKSWASGPKRWMRLPDLPPEHRETWRKTVTAMLLQSLKLHHDLLFQATTRENWELCDRDKKRLEIATEWLDRYLPKAKQEIDLSGTLATIPREVWSSLTIDCESSATASPILSDGSSGSTTPALTTGRTRSLANGPAAGGSPESAPTASARPSCSPASEAGSWHALRPPE